MAVSYDKDLGDAGVDAPYFVLVLNSFVCCNFCGISDTSFFCLYLAGRKPRLWPSRLIWPVNMTEILTLWESPAYWDDGRTVENLGEKAEDVVSLILAWWERLVVCALYQLMMSWILWRDGCESSSISIRFSYLLTASWMDGFKSFKPSFCRFLPQLNVRSATFFIFCYRFLTVVHHQGPSWHFHLFGRRSQLVKTYGSLCVVDWYYNS